MLIDLNALRFEVDRRDAERPAAKRQWDKLPVGTRFSDMANGFATITAHSTWADEPAIEAEIDDGGFGIWLVSELDAAGSIAPSEFADAYKRDTLAKLGFFSIDNPAYRERYRNERFEEAKRFSAARALGIDRDALLAHVARDIEARRGSNGITARSTAEFANKRDALDNAILYAAGVTEHA